MSQRTIWKFPLYGGEENNFWALMPLGAEPLSAAYQDGRFVVWAAVDRDRKDLTEHRWFHIAGTNHALPKAPGAPLGRVEISGVDPRGLPLIFHVFSSGQEPAHG